MGWSPMSPSKALFAFYNRKRLAKPIDGERAFGPYLLSVHGNQATIRRMDHAPVEPTFYELQHLKDMAFGGAATAVEVFPAHRDLVDGEHQRHLWHVDSTIVPNMFTGEGVQHDIP